MLRRAALVAILFAWFAPATVHAQAADCIQFREAMTRAAGDLHVDFSRPLVVGRNSSGLDQFDLVSRGKIDGVLRCRGDAFVRFEAKIHLPADAAQIELFDQAQMAALVAATGWARSRARARIAEISVEVADYLRGSAERGDVTIAGKLEEHLPGGVDLGAIWTRTDRSFLVLRSE